MKQPSSSVVVRKAKVADVAALARIHHASWVHSVGAQFPNDILERKTIAYRVHQWTTAIDDGSSSPPPLVAEMDGRVIGFVATKLESSSVGEIEKLYVDPGFRGLGVGKNSRCMRSTS